MTIQELDALMKFQDSQDPRDGALKLPGVQRVVEAAFVEGYRRGEAANQTPPAPIVPPERNSQGIRYDLCPCYKAAIRHQQALNKALRANLPKRGD